MPDLLLILIVILILAILWRGPKTLPKIGEALGRGVKEAKAEATTLQSEIQARATGEGTTPTPPGTTPDPTDASDQRPT